MPQAQWCPYTLDFSFTAITSRQAMRHKDTYLIRVPDAASPGGWRAGECALFRGLSAEDCGSPEAYEEELARACLDPEAALTHPYSSIRFGFEQLLRPAPPSPWSRGEEGIAINGLVWMADKHTMAARIAAKLDAGFSVLKLKIGGIDFDDELDLIASVRRSFSPEALEIRLDANGSFTPADALGRLERLAAYGIHSLEQPIRAGQPEAMAEICRRSPIAIALDEELIGTRSPAEARRVVEAIMPQYLILKPSLCGGFGCADEYISIARSLGIGWWATSALESDIGLQAIASWVGTKGVTMPQGLGTGMLYTNNFRWGLRLRGSSLWLDTSVSPDTLDTLPWRS